VGVVLWACEAHVGRAYPRRGPRPRGTRLSEEGVAQAHTKRVRPMVIAGFGTFRPWRAPRSCIRD